MTSDRVISKIDALLLQEYKKINPKAQEGPAYQGFRDKVYRELDDYLGIFYRCIRGLPKKEENMSEATYRGIKRQYRAGINDRRAKKVSDIIHRRLNEELNKARRGLY